MQAKAPQTTQGAWLVEEQPQAVLGCICWGSAWINPKELLFWGIFRWEEGAARLYLVLQVCSAATCRTPTTDSCQPLNPPCPGPNRVRARWHHKPTWGAPYQPSPSGMGPADGCSMGDFWGALAGKPEGKLRIKLSPEQVLKLAILQGNVSPHFLISFPQGLGYPVFLFSMAWAAPSTGLLKLPDDPRSALSVYKTLLPSETEELFCISARCKPCQQECPRSAVQNIVKHLQSSHLPCTSHFWGGFVKSWLRTEPNWQDFAPFSY